MLLMNCDLDHSPWTASFQRASPWEDQSLPVAACQIRIEMNLNRVPGCEGARTQGTSTARFFMGRAAQFQPVSLEANTRLCM